VTWLIVASGLALGVDWRRLGLLGIALLAPLPTACVIAIHWWRARPGLSMRAARFCEAVSGELRAGASLRGALESAGVSVQAWEMARLCSESASMEEIAGAARAEFTEIGPELGALLARADGAGVSPAALFAEIGSLALAQVEVTHEVSIASAPARATGAVLLVLPLMAVGWALSRNDVEPYLRHPAQRLAVLTGLGLILTGLVSSMLILRRAR
jgi:hypothetical protein